jgi:hypothetical protein
MMPRPMLWLARPVNGKVGPEAISTFWRLGSGARPGGICAQLENGGRLLPSGAPDG